MLRSFAAWGCFALLVGCSTDEGGNANAAGNGGNVTSGGAGATAGGNSSGGTSAGGVTSGGSSTGGTTSGGSSASGASSGGASGNGAGGNDAGGAGSMTAAMGSPGCTMPAGQALGSWVEQPQLNVNGQDRQWWVWLPTGYDASKPYPLVFTFHGCSSPDNIVPMQKVAGDKAILVRGTGISDGVCWDANATGDDVKFFDQMLADVLAKRCVDSTRVFLTGYSSGSWLVNTLDCERGDKVRASGTVSGGTYGDKSKCKGEYARLFIHDQDDTTNRIDQGDSDERDRLIMANHCNASAMPLPEDPAPCARYQGCDPGFPVIWCQTQGKMHDRQDSLAPGAFWGLFSTL